MRRNVYATSVQSSFINVCLINVSLLISPEEGYWLGSIRTVLLLNISYDTMVTISGVFRNPQRMMPWQGRGTPS